MSKKAEIVIETPSQRIMLTMDEARKLVSKIILVHWRLSATTLNSLLKNNEVDATTDIIRIYLALKTIFPQNVSLIEGWPTAFSSRYNSTNLDYMLRNGIGCVKKDVETEAYLR